MSPYVRRFFPATLVLIACACSGAGNDDETDPDKSDEAVVWQDTYTEKECRRLMDWDEVLERCGRGNLHVLSDMLSNDPTACFPFSPPQLMEGVWLRAFEFSAFYEGAQDYGDVLEVEGEVLDGDTWFSPEKADNLIAMFPSSANDTAASSSYYVKFEGRKSLCQGEYGHLGGSSSEVLATHFLTIRRIPEVVEP